jgi:hypothetical protein
MSRHLGLSEIKLYQAKCPRHSAFPASYRPGNILRKIRNLTLLIDHPKSYHSHQRDVVLLLLIDGLVAGAFLVLWYVLMARFNRRKGAAALRVVEAACYGRGKIPEARWVGSNRLQAHLRFATHWVEDAKVTVSLRPRHSPLQWLVSTFRKQKETLTFEANLDCAPGFQLEVFRHQWLTEKVQVQSKREWMISRPGPIVLTTQAKMGSELTPVVNTLMSTSGHSLMNVRFRSDAPHLTATIPLEAVSGEESSVAFLNVLRSLAASASSTSHQ